MVFTFPALWSDYTLISIFVVFISIAITSIIYMIGKALSNDKLTAWAVDEVYQAFGSILIIAFVVFIIGFFITFSLQLLNISGFSCDQNTCTYTEIRMKPAWLSAGTIYTSQMTCGAPGNACQIAIAKSKVNSMFDLVRFTAADKVYRAGWLRMMKSFEFTLQEPLKQLLQMIGMDTGAKLVPFMGLSTLIDSYGSVVDMLTNISKFLMVHNVFLDMTEKVIFPLFLVMGIALRSFSPMRKLGGLLIAIAVGLYFVYPFMFILQSLILSPNPNTFPITFEQFTENMPVQVTYNEKTQPEQNIFTGLFSWFYVKDANGQDIDMITAYVFRMVQSGGDLDTTAFLGVWIILPEIIVIYTVVIFIKELSPFFGGDAKIEAISKLL